MRGVADAVRLVERVSGEGLDGVENLARDLGLLSLAVGELHEPFTFGLHEAGDFLTHRLAYYVGLSHRVAGEGL